MNDERTDLFFKPRQVVTQFTLDFLSVPPSREGCFSHEASEFTGLRLHWIGGRSVLCEDELGGCRHCERSDAHDYYYTDFHLWSYAERRFITMLLPLGADIYDFQCNTLVGKSWRIDIKKAKDGRKKGLRLIQVTPAVGTHTGRSDLTSVDIRPRLLKRYNRV